MSERKTVEPIVTEVDRFGSSEKRLEHPAFGQITVSRISGHAHLYGSDFTHHSSVRISIHESELTRHINTDWPYAKREIIEVEMSEAQWAAFVSSFGLGSGVQCTIRHRDGQTVPGFPLRDEASEFRSDMSSQSTDALAALERAVQAVAAAKISKKDAETILDGIRKAAQEIGVNADFVQECFDRHMEERVQKARTEIDAYFQNVVRSVGIAALKGEAHPLLAKHDDEPAPPAAMKDGDAALPEAQRAHDAGRRG